MSDASKVADMGVQARGRARRGSPAVDHRIGDDHGKRVPQACRRARSVAMRTSMWMLISQYDLSALLSSGSEALDNLCDLQYGLELVIPMSSRRLEKR
jgi:hypothetical protein